MERERERERETELRARARALAKDQVAVYGGVVSFLFPSHPLHVIVAKNDTPCGGSIQEPRAAESQLSGSKDRRMGDG